MISSERTYRVAWSNNDTGQSGYFQPTTLADAKAFVVRMNRDYPGILRWVEEHVGDDWLPLAMEWDAH
ncbi:MAG: hypothetical protein MPJ50_12620 [Pirellulales bacterium]|nr:hypothetical protein [Pirellulales bacterium]